MTTTTQVTDLPSWAKEPMIRTLGAAEELIQEPYTPYGGPRVADFTADQQAGFDAVRGIEGSGAANMGLAALYGQQGAQTFAEGFDANAYINPFISAAIDPAAREIDRRNAQILNRQNATAGMSNAFGGSRAALLEGVQNRNYMEEIGDLYAGGHAAGFDRGVAAFMQDQDRLLRASDQFEGLARTGQEMDINQADALLRSGGQQQALTQASLDTAYQDFLDQRNWPYSQLSFMQSMIRGIPQIGTINTQTVEQTEPNQYSQFLGAGLTGLSLLDGLFSDG